MSMRCDNAECPEAGIEKRSWQVPDDAIVICGVCSVPCTHLPDRPEDDPFVGAQRVMTPVEQWQADHA